MQTPRDASRLWKFFYWLLTVLKPLLCRLQVEGTENVPTTGGCVIASNHSMGPDYVVLGYASPRQIFYMAKIELFHIHPWLSKLLTSIGTFPIDRGRNDTEALTTAETLLQQGKVLGMFPEGTRSRTGELRRGKTGAVRLAMKMGVPVVPAVVINGEAIFKRFGRRPQVIVRFGPPLYPTGDANHKTIPRDQTDLLMRNIALLLPPAQRGIYGQAKAESTTTVAVDQLEVPPDSIAN